MREVPLLTWLIVMMGAAVLATFVTVGGGILAYRLPQLDARAVGYLKARTDESVSLIEVYARGVESHLGIHGRHVGRGELGAIQNDFDSIVGTDFGFAALLLIAPDGRVASLVLPPGRQREASERQGTDMRSSALYRKARLMSPGAAPLWSDKYTSVITGDAVIGVATLVGQHVVIGELPTERLSELLKATVREEESMTAVIDGQGQWLASTAPASPGGQVDLSTLAELRTALADGAYHGRANLPGTDIYLSAKRVPSLNWLISTSSPAGWNHYNYRMTIVFVLVGFIGSLIIGCLLMWWWASRLSRPITRLTDRVHLASGGDYLSPWPGMGSVREMNQLSRDLERMSALIRQREAGIRKSEQMLEAIFNASPAPMSVSDTHADHRVIAVNPAWERQFQRTRAQALGRNGQEMGLWADPGERARFLAQLERDNRVDGFEAVLIAGSDTRLLCQISAVYALVGHKDLMLMMAEDVTERRRVEFQVRQLNAELEERVVERTEELSAANDELSAAVANLEATQQQLVQSEKLAALGNLVAGVAHELNTPIGNGLMAVSTMRGGLVSFREELSRGLRRSMLDGFLARMDTGTDIAERNLQRAATLVTSFKQVAVDQSSSQRRTFELRDLVDEILLTLHPMLKRTPFRVEVAVDDGLQLVSFPGPLGQVLTNLINNAVQHGLEGRDEGAIRITARTFGVAQLTLCVHDDGRGIPAAHLNRLFEPFFTTRMGSGGTGLGLHIVHNIVTGMLGGTIVVRSDADYGTEFELTLPLAAPSMELAER